MHVKDYQPEYYEKLTSEMKASVLPTLPFKIVATDQDTQALNAAKANAEHAEVTHLVEFIRTDFITTTIPPAPGIVIFNPPYGERLGASAELESIYEGIGDFMKKNCKGYWGYVFTGNQELAGKIGLKAKKKTDFLNGQIKCKLLEYELYEGTRKRRAGNENDIGQPS
jgi:putative N6-adenine-specific DNA methylase